MSHAFVSDLNNLQSTLLNGLDYYKDDIRIMETRLLEMAEKKSSFEDRQGIEHFQNQFILQRNNIGRLRHHINDFVREAIYEISVYGKDLSGQLYEKQRGLQEEYRGLEKIISDLLKDFNQFLKKSV